MSQAPANTRQTKLAPLEFRVFQAWRGQAALKGSRILVACSGGADSVALASVLHRVSQKLGFEIALAHVHHGPSRSRKIKAARAQAYASVAELSERLGVEFLSLTDGKRVRTKLMPDPRSIALRFAAELKSEEQLRARRHSELEELRVQRGFAFIAFAHHADDLFETRLIRLVRGTGPQGLEAMRAVDGVKVRPFLTEPRAELENYLRARRMKWIDDPTNLDTEPLRNWLRKTWLPALEAKRPGALRSFRRSLELIAEERGRDLSEGFTADGAAISRGFFKGLAHAERKRLLANYLLHKGMRDFGVTHIEEIAKRLDTSQKVFTFELLRFRWEINAQQIRALRI